MMKTIAIIIIDNIFYSSWQNTFSISIFSKHLLINTLI